MLFAISIALVAHWRALLTRAARDVGAWPGTEGGTCWAREMERLFTILVSTRIHSSEVLTYSEQPCDNLTKAIA